jgi:hypothetical protein
MPKPEREFFVADSEDVVHTGDKEWERWAEPARRVEAKPVFRRWSLGWCRLSVLAHEWVRRHTEVSILSRLGEQTTPLTMQS